MKVVGLVTNMFNKRKLDKLKNLDEQNISEEDETAFLDLAVKGLEKLLRVKRKRSRKVEREDEEEYNPPSPASSDPKQCKRTVKQTDFYTPSTYNAPRKKQKVVSKDSVDSSAKVVQLPSTSSASSSASSSTSVPTVDANNLKVNLNADIGEADAYWANGNEKFIGENINKTGMLLI